MDSVSQAVFGGVVAVVVTGGRHPRRAALTGALLGSLPDLDVLVPQPNDLEAMINHRTWSHSWLVQTVVSPLLAFLFHRIDTRWQSWRHGSQPPPDAGWTFRQWFLLVWLVLLTHSVLDAMTIYGTWLFWPLGTQPVMGGSIFIIDPLFTLPLGVGLAMLMRWRPPGRALRVAGVSLGLSIAYLGWGFAMQQHVEAMAARALDANGLASMQLVATPTPFNSVLWRVLAIDDDSYLEGFHALGESEASLRFTAYPRQRQLAETLDHGEDALRFSSFNHGFHAFREVDGHLVGEDLRMGSNPYFFFAFVFGDRLAGSSSDNPAFRRIEPWRYDGPVHPGHFFDWMWRRLRDPGIVPLSEWPLPVTTAQGGSTADEPLMASAGNGFHPQRSGLE